MVDLDAFAAEHGFTKIDPISVNRFRYHGERGRGATPWSTASYKAPPDRVVMGDDPGDFTVSVLSDCDGRFIMGIGLHPGWKDQRAYSVSATRSMIAHHGTQAIAEREASHAAWEERTAAERAAREAADAATHDRFVALVKRAAQAGAEIGRLNSRVETATISFDDLDRLLTLCEER